MPKIAVDIALLPSKEIMDKAIEINRQAADESIALGKIDCLPHITLCMGVLEEKDLPKVNEIIASITAGLQKVNLKIRALNNERLEFLIEKNADLQHLHEKIMTSLEPYLSYDSTA